MIYSKWHILISPPASIAELQSATRKYVELRRTLAKATSPEATVPAPPNDLTHNADNIKRDEDELSMEEISHHSPAHTADSTMTGPSAIPSSLSVKSGTPQQQQQQPLQSQPGETRRLLERIGFLTADSVRLSEEKMALATTVYDLVSASISLPKNGQEQGF